MQGQLSGSWSTNINALAKGYRMAALELDGFGFWIGGSAQTYNYDGIAYNGSGGVEPLKRYVRYEPFYDNLEIGSNDVPAVMDLRGIGDINNGEYIIAGGMLSNQEVSNKTFKLMYSIVSTKEPIVYNEIKVFPNPSQFFIQIEGVKAGRVKIFSIDGKIVLEQSFENGQTISVETLPNGIYEVLIQQNAEFSKGRFVIMR